ncbi:ABC transporter substrate-binding protein [Pseudonocardia sp. MH-G8]|uniref:ABC transporter substrate-binding protein n=1 Tax=Pseudonocardia sp. MH-G8 TaxID=1854588 RepID=UPI001303FAE3|nr:ABC transporter substrate-binding protein [Pseudonocardia sp. MH-G8]
MLKSQLDSVATASASAGGMVVPVARRDSELISVRHRRRRSIPEDQPVTAHRQINRHSRLVGGCLAVVLTSAACGGSDDSGSGAGADAGGLISVSYGTAGTPVVYGSILPHVADEEGIYEKYGLEVTFQNFANGADSLRAVVGGQLDAAMTSTSNLVNVVAQGAEVKAMAGMDKPDYYIATTDPSISSCEDLAGQTIGVDQTGGARYNGTVAMLASCGLTVDDVTFVNFAGPPIIQALVQGQITVGTMHYDEEAFIETTTDVALEEVISLVKDVNPNTHYVEQVAMTDYIEENRDTVVRLTAAYIEANDFIRDPANIDRFAEIAAEHNGQPIEVARQSIELFLEFEFWPEGSGIDDGAKFQGVIDEQIGAGAVTEAEAPAYEDMVDLSIYEDAMELVGSTN